MIELHEYERCENCQSFAQLKHNFKIGIGYEDSCCCLLFANEKEVIETSPNSMCECFKRRTDDA